MQSKMLRAVRHFDDKLTEIIQGWSKSLKPIFDSATIIGDPMIVIPVAFCGAVISNIRGQHLIMWAFLATVAAALLNLGLKQFLHRRRPLAWKRVSIYSNILRFESYSFPSSHAFGSFVTYGLIAILCIKYIAAPLSYITACLLLFLSVVIGLSRIYLGSHYPSDVIAGWFFGGASLLAIALFFI